MIIYLYWYILGTYIHIILSLRRFWACTSVSYYYYVDSIHKEYCVQHSVIMMILFNSIFFWILLLTNHHSDKIYNSRGRIFFNGVLGASASGSGYSWCFFKELLVIYIFILHFRQFKKFVLLSTFLNKVIIDFMERSFFRWHYFEVIYFGECLIYRYIILLK